MKNARRILGATVAMMMLPAMAQAEVTVYGKIHMSADAVDIGAGGGHGISSNSSRIGFKGKEDLNYGLSTIWKIESELDISSKSSAFGSRDRYLGLSYGKSTLVGGYFNTPFKTMGGKSDAFADTIADHRGVMGMDYVSGHKKFDVRAPDAVMYINNSVKDLEFRLMRSAGSPHASAGDTTPITSTSFMYKTSQFLVGAAYEAKEALRTSGLRLIGGVAFGGTRVTGIYEQLDFGDSNAELGWDRSAMGINAVHKMGATTLKAQARIVNDLDSDVDSGAKMYVAGVSHKLAKPFEIYGMYAYLENDKNAKYTLSGSGHGDKYRPSDAGVTMSAVSFGGVYKF
ncbi:MAG: porin [Gammaproteobacteria bacterium]|nr:porin [Gammaproteobacteria bacterium]